MTRWITEKEAERSRQQRQGFWTPKRIVGAIGIAVLTIYFIISLLVWHGTWERNNYHFFSRHQLSQLDRHCRPADHPLLSDMGMNRDKARSHIRRILCPNSLSANLARMRPCDHNLHSNCAGRRRGYHCFLGHR